MIERFAQEWAHYPTDKSEDVFCDFILEHNSSYNWLEEINPVTLCYDFKWDGCEEIDLSVLEDGYIYTSVSIKKILDIDGTNFDKIKTKKHRYVNQIYKMRNKLSHEGHFSSWTKISSRQNENLPCFISIGCEGNIHWHFAIPYTFLEKLAMECIIRFLDERKRHNKDPFDHNSIEGKHNLAWVSEQRKYTKQK